MPTQSGIYTITNIVTGDLYVGSSVQIPKRWANHLWELRRGSHHSEYLQRAYSKYGEEAFVFAVIEEVHIDAELLLQREQYWVDTLHPQYNLCPVVGSQLGLVHTEERNRKQSASMKAAWDSKSEEARKNFSEKASQRRHSEETKQKQRERKLGTKQSEETKRKRAESLKCHDVSEENRQKLAERSRAMWASRTPEEKRAVIQKRPPVSEETRRKQSESAKRRRQKAQQAETLSIEQQSLFD